MPSGNYTTEKYIELLDHSLYYTPEATKMLYVNYISIKNNIKKKWYNKKKQYAFKLRLTQFNNNASKYTHG